MAGSEPTAYINPPANPPLNSVYMLSSREGWAVGDSLPTTNDTNNAVFPAILHYDGATWNLVPAPKNPTELNPNVAVNNIPGPYNLTSVSFGPPNNPISRNDGWAVGFTESPSPGAPSPIALHWDGISWKAQLAGLTAGVSLFSVFMVSPTDVWAVGTGPGGGQFWHWTGVPGLGGGWNLPQPAVATVSVFFSVFMVSPTEGWAVGTGGAIYHYFGGTWTAFPSPTTQQLNSVFMISATEGWTVGSQGTIFHYTTGIWTGPVSPGTTTNDLLSVFMVSSTEGWAVGKLGTIVHYSGGTWTALPINLVPTLPAGGTASSPFNFRSVYLNNAADGWGVGTLGVILHWDGANWGTVTSSTLTELASISFGPPLSPITPNDGWAVGGATSALAGPPATTEPTIIHWNGFMWTKGVAIGTMNNLYSVFMVSSGDVWAVGGGQASTASCTATAANPCPVILHFQGGSWNTVTPPTGGYVLYSVFMVNPNEGWAVGCQGTVAQCVRQTGQTTGGQGIILHYTVTGGVGSWAIFPIGSPSTTIPPLNSVFMVSANEGWAVGNYITTAPPGGPIVLHYTVTGGVGNWNVVTIGGLVGTQGNLNSVFMLSPTSGWAVGGYTLLNLANPRGPIIVYWDGSKWTPVATPTIPGGPDHNPPTLNSVYFTGPNDGWAVGNATVSPPPAGPAIRQLVSTIFHWDGIAWTHVTLAPALLGLAPDTVSPPNLTSVYMTSPSNGWIVGGRPLLTTISPPLPLSTILLFSPFGGLLAATSTATYTVVSTVSTSTTAIVTSATSTFMSTLTSSTTTTTTATATASPGGVPGFPAESIVIGFVVGVVALMLLRRRRNRSPRA